MKKKDIILASLAASDGAIHTPVQIQKLLFLIDKKIPDLLEGAHFNFIPYAYGPFDREVNYLLKEMSNEGDIEIMRSPHLNWSRYRLTLQGQKKGERVLEGLETETSEYIGELSSFVRNMSFGQLVSAIYKEYPEMKENSVF